MRLRHGTIAISVGLLSSAPAPSASWKFTKIDGTSIAMPGLEGTPYQYGYIAGNNGVVAFVAQDQQDSSGNRRTGLYLYEKGKIVKIAASGDTIAGDIISSFYGDYYNITMSTTALENGTVAFWAMTTTGELANYVAQP